MADKKFNAGIEISIIDRSSVSLRAIKGGMEGIERAGSKASKAFELAANLKHAADGVKSFTVGITSAIKGPIDKFTDFEEIMSSVRANTFNGEVTAKTQAEFKALSETARKLGADTKYSGKEAAEGMVLLATSGFTAQQQMDAMPGVLNLAASANESIADAAGISAKAMAQFGLEATDMGRIGDVIAKTAQSSQTGLLDLGEALAYAGSSARDAGVDIEQTTALLGVLGDVGVKGSAAGTTLRSIFSSLQAPSKKGKSALAFLGINTKDKAGNMRPIEQLLAEMDKAMDKKFGKGKNGARRSALLKGLFDEANAANAGLLIAGAGSGKVTSKISDNRAAAGTAAKVAADMSNNTAGAAKELDSALEELQLTIGEVLIPTVVDLLKWSKEITVGVTAWAKENPELVQGLSAMAGGIAIVGGGLWAMTTAVSAGATAMGFYRGVMEGTNTTGKILTATNKAITAGVKLMNIAFASTPITLIIAGIAAGALLIYEYWEPISGFFTGLWDSVTAGFKSAMDWILTQINWVGEKIEMFKVSILTPEQAAVYAAEKAATVEASARAATNDQYGGLFSDDLDRQDPNSITSKKAGNGDFYAKSAEQNAGIATSEIKSAMAGWKDDSDFAELQDKLGKFYEDSANGKPLMPADAAAGRIFNGNLMITVNADGSVTKTELKQQGDPNFEVRVNRGSAAA